MHSRTGAVSGEAVLALIICLMMVPVCVMSVGSASMMLGFRQEVQDETALLQLRRILLLSYDLQTDGRVLTYEYQNREFRLSLVNDYLVMQPGTLIFVSEIDDAYFLQKENGISLVYVREGKEYERFLSGI